MQFFSPAKINLFLAVTGKRPDGYHSLVSLVAPLEFGDDLTVEESGNGKDQLECDSHAVPLDGSNLILQAAEGFRRKSGEDRYFHFNLKKRIPLGGGFGGGSSNAVCALKAMNQLSGSPLDFGDLLALAEELGSDCPLFLEEGPVIMRGRGEILEPVPELNRLLRDRVVCLFNPGFFSSTADLFRKMAERGKYTDTAVAEEKLGNLIKVIREGQTDWPIYNDLGNLLAEKYLYYATWFALLRKLGLTEYGVTGSGCGAFVLSRRESDRRKIEDLCGRFLEGDGFMVETRFAGNKDG